MRWAAAQVKWIMLVSGLLTCTMLYAALFPEAALRTTFGATLEGPLAEIVVRNWGALITLVGGMLVYGAFHPPVRVLVLIVAALGKALFIALVLIHGHEYLGHAALVLVCDTVMVALFAACLAGTRPADAP